MTTFLVGGISGGKTKIAEKRKRQLRETDEDPSAKNRPKKKTYYQNFRQEYRTMYPALRSSAEGPQLAQCTVCKSDFSIAHGAKNDCKKHCDTQSHQSLTLVQHVRIFSMVRKTCTEGRSSMLQDTTEALLVLKTKPGFLDEGREFSDTDLAYITRH